MHSAAYMSLLSCAQLHLASDMSAPLKMHPCCCRRRQWPGQCCRRLRLDWSNAQWNSSAVQRRSCRHTQRLRPRSCGVGCGVCLVAARARHILCTHQRRPRSYWSLQQQPTRRRRQPPRHHQQLCQRRLSWQPGSSCGPQEQAPGAQQGLAPRAAGRGAPVPQEVGGRRHQRQPGVAHHDQHRARSAAGAPQPARQRRFRSRCMCDTLTKAWSCCLHPPFKYRRCATKSDLHIDKFRPCMQGRCISSTSAEAAAAPPVGPPAS